MYLGNTHLINHFHLIWCPFILTLSTNLCDYCCPSLTSEKKNLSVSHDCDLWNPGGPQDLFRGFLRSTCFNNATVFAIFTLILPQVYSGVSKDCIISDYIITLSDNKMCACIFLCFEDFLVLTFSRVNLGRCSPHRQKLFGVPQ